MGSVVIGPCKTNKIINNFKGTLTEFGAQMLLGRGGGGRGLLLAVRTTTIAGCLIRSAPNNFDSPQPPVWLCILTGILSELL